MTDETIIHIKRSANGISEDGHSPGYAEVQFTRNELIFLKLAVSHHRTDCSEKEYSDMIRLIKASSVGFDAERHYAERYCGVKYRDERAVIRFSRNQFNAMCIAVLTSADELRYLQAAFPESFANLQDKLIRVMDGFRSGEYSFILDGDLRVVYFD